MMLGRELTPWQTPLRAITEMQREMNQLFSRFFGEGEQAGKPVGLLERQLRAAD